MTMQTPSLQKVIDDAIESKLLEVHTCLPARVTRVDVTKAQCDVKPLIKRKYANETIVELPVITNVPIAFYRAGQAFVSLPVKVGDIVELRFAERSLDLWLTKGGTVDPLDSRRHHLSDAIAYPGIYPFTDPPTGASATDIVIKNETSKITIKPDQIELYGNGDAVALASLVLSRLETIKSTFDSHTHTQGSYINSGGPVTGSSGAPTSTMPTPDSVASTKVKTE